jgi:hypothetical protein
MSGKLIKKTKKEDGEARRENKLYRKRESGKRRKEKGKRGEEIIDEEKKGKLWTFKENVSGRGHGGGGARGGEGG